jgi:hypothetical protein
MNAQIKIMLDVDRVRDSFIWEGDQAQAESLVAQMRELAGVHFDQVISGNAVAMLSHSDPNKKRGAMGMFTAYAMTQ